MFYNPASLGRITGSDVQFTFNRWLADINYNYAAAGVSVEGIGTFALVATILNSGDMDVRTVEQPLGTGERFSVKNLAFGLGYGLMVTDRVSIGIQINYITETIWHSSISTFGINLGVQYQIMQEGLTIGASLSNFGASTSYDGRDLFLNYDFDPDKGTITVSKIADGELWWEKNLPFTGVMPVDILTVEVNNLPKFLSSLSW